MKFGEYLQQQGLCSPDHISAALAVMQFRKQKLGRVLVELGFLQVQTLDSALMKFLNPNTALSYGELKARRDQVPLKIREPIERRHPEVLVIDTSESQLTLSCSWFSDQLLAQIEEETGLDVKPILIRKHIFQLLEGKELEDKKPQSNIIVTGDLSCDQKLLEEHPHTRLIRQCLEEACQQKASDVHFEPFGDCFLIRFRVHGVLSDWKSVLPDHTEPLVNKLKWVLNLDLAIASKPQDSRAHFESLAADMRVNSMPTASGAEKIVIRIQYQEQKLSLADIGLDQTKIDILRRNIGKREGLIVISGPTGSGKTTTLYALLEEMDRLGKNISTLENPVEKSLERINQSNVASKEDFYEFQRALMRQDPDVILLGEIRDPETADLSMKLASTGHLVLSTVHANGAREVVDRLLNLGVDEFTVKNNLRLSVAQRLLRRLCPNCKTDNPDGTSSTNKTGCEQCKGGVIGRLAIIEYLERSDLEKSTPPTTLEKECENLVKKGVVDVSELLSM